MKWKNLFFLLSFLLLLCSSATVLAEEIDETDWQLETLTRDAQLISIQIDYKH